MMRKLTVLLLLVALPALWGKAATRQIDIADDDADYRYDGIDVSSYQKDIDWTATARDKNIKFVYVKATEGTTHRSRHYRRNIENARANGVKVGSYHFIRTSSPIKSQFENFISIVKKEEQDLVPLIDIEVRRGWTAQQLRDSVKAFADLIEEHFGCKPMIYTSSSFFNNYLWQTFSDYPLFIARYSASQPQLVNGAKWTLWQFSERGRIQGIDANVDLCRFNKGCDVSMLLMRQAKKIKGSAKTTVPPPPPRKVDKPVEVPYPPNSKEAKKLQKEAEKKKKEAEKQAKKQAELQERIRKQKEKERVEREKKLAKEQEKQRKEQAKQHELDEKRQEEMEKRQAQLAKQQESKAKPASNAQKPSLPGSRPQPPKQMQQNAAGSKKVNKSTADNDDDISMPTKRNR